MLVIEKYEGITDLSKASKEKDFCNTLFSAYQSTKKAGNERLNFDEIIWGRDIELIIKLLKEFGISEFTISSAASNLMEILAIFQNNNIVIRGIVGIKEPYDERKVPAILMKVQ